MNSTVAVVSTVSRQILTNIFQRSVRYQKKPSTMAHTQAAMAPSVGVKTPVVMPPISRTGVMMGSTAWNLNSRSATNSTTKAPATVSWACHSHCLTSTQTTTGQITTTAVSIRALSHFGPDKADV
jgi:hypothetical protein